MYGAMGKVRCQSKATSGAVLMTIICYSINSCCLKADSQLYGLFYKMNQLLPPGWGWVVIIDEYNAESMI
ncbi:hypothetical protein DAY22_05580 [Lactiplantibacillus plantarum]|nr:hypothetical protein CHF38_05580 [Lactiplantibacillus plantarum]RAH95863.1 hypothetical protein DAY22_05580 [Lactiplantibacillus plantarum]